MQVTHASTSIFIINRMGSEFETKHRFVRLHMRKSMGTKIVAAALWGAKTEYRMEK
jgi:hypothetical protein